MAAQRIHIVGASGSGTTTLGAALAAEMGVAHQDSDHFWLPTEPPFTTQRPQDERLPMLKAALPAEESWVISGSLLSWGLEVAPRSTWWSSSISIPKSAWPAAWRASACATATGSSRAATCMRRT